MIIILVYYIYIPVLCQLYNDTFKNYIYHTHLNFLNLCLACVGSDYEDPRFTCLSLTPFVRERIILEFLSNFFILVKLLDYK